MTAHPGRSINVHIWCATPNQMDQILICPRKCVAFLPLNQCKKKVQSLYRPFDQDFIFIAFALQLDSRYWRPAKFEAESCVAHSATFADCTWGWEPKKAQASSPNGNGSVSVVDARATLGSSKRVGQKRRSARTAWEGYFHRPFDHTDLHRSSQIFTDF